MKAPAGSFPRGIRILGGLAIAVLLIVGFTPLVALLDGRLAPAVPIVPPTRADAVVVLGAGLSPEGVLSENSLRRAVEGIALVQEGRAPILVIQGPRFSGPAVEAAVRAGLARRLGVRADQILVEPRGNTTVEEARVAWERLGESRRHIILVTGRYHMPRARRMFTRAGFDVTPAAVTEEAARSARADGRLRVARAMLTEAIAWTYNRLAGSL